MSRKISIQEKKKWLEMFEQGLTENQVAKKVKRDLRTIVNGLQEASTERHLANAEAEMLRNALFSHQNKLTSVLTNISTMLVLPSPNLELREDENGSLQPLPLAGSLMELNPDKQLTLKIHDEGKLEWEMLVEHLKSDDLWKYLKKWKQAVIDHFQASWQFKQSIKSALQKKTGLKLKDSSSKMAEYLLPVIVELFYEVAMHKLLGIKEGTNLEENLVAGEDGTIRHGSTELARCKKSSECRDKIISIFISLPKTVSASEVKRTHSELTDITRKAKRQVEEILLLGMITGKCRVCSRLGK
jgi:hypothetical protein